MTLLDGFGYRGAAHACAEECGDVAVAGAEGVHNLDRFRFPAVELLAVVDDRAVLTEGHGNEPRRPRLVAPEHRLDVYALRDELFAAEEAVVEVGEDARGRCDCAGC